MKKIGYVIFILGFFLITFGIYKLLFSNNNTPKTNINFSGKYVYSDETIYVYQDNDDSLYFIHDDVYGKVNGKNNKYNGTINGVTYSFEFKDDTLNISSSDSKTNGSYKKEEQLTIEGFYNTKFGDIGLLNSAFNGKYKKDDIEINIYQSIEEEVTGFIKNKEKTVLLHFTIDANNYLMCKLDEDNYIISLHNESILFTKESDSDFINEEIPFISNLTIKDILNLYSQN